VLSLVAVGTVALAVAAVVVALRAGDGGSSATPPDRPASVGVRGDVATPGVASVGDRAPGFSLRALDGRTVHLDDFGGRPLIVNFWASWCLPCREDFPALAAARRRHRNDDLAVVGVLFRDIPSDARAFAREQGADWPMLDDPDRATATDYGVRAVPTTLFVDRGGVIRARYFGAPTTAQLDDALATILPEG
jgi:cytochrome c biogenesis protein CcmG/thiol:disulfide interchange protein DsbE